MDSLKQWLTRALPEDSTFGTIDRLFDFTLLFQNYVFAIPLALCVILATPAFITRAVHKKRCTDSGSLLFSKACVMSILIVCELANVVLCTTNASLHSIVSVTAAILAFGASICTAIILYVAHAYSIQPSTFLSIYLAISALFDMVKCRSYFIRTGLASVGGLSAAFVVLRFTLVALEEISKAHLVKAEHRRKPLGRELVSGFWNRSLFIWLNPTLILGFKKDITINELPDPGPEFDSEDLHDRFEPNWEKGNKNATFALGLACIRTLQWEFVAVFIPRVCCIGFRFGQPFLVWRLITFIGQTEQPASVKGGLIGATFFIYFGMAITTVYFEHLNYRMATFVRGILVSAIFRKTLKLSHDQLKKSSALTLMSTDVTGIERMFPLFHDTWAGAVELAIGLYVLTTYIGAAAFLLLIPISIMAAITTHISKKMGKARSGWNLKIEERVAVTKNILAQIKSIKASGFAPAVSELLQNKRLEEIDFSSKERWLRVMLHVLQGIAEGLTPVVVVAGGLFWTRTTDGLSAADIFTTLSVVAIVSGPLSRILVCMPFFVGSIACLGRIQNFLLLEEVTDTRIIEDDDEAPISATTIVEKPFGGLHANTRYAFHLQSASITLPGKDEPLIRNASMKDGHRGDVTMIYGPVGCGKSTLLKAVIGEVEVSSGSVRLGAKYVAYCDQSAWLQNGSIRDNIIAQTPYIAERYRDVLFCCALDEDLKLLPDGDKTLVGSHGLALSGGQRQRVAVARAMYACAPLVVLDDAMSALDMATAKMILSRIFRKGSTVRMFDTSVIMTTNVLEHLPLADVVYSINESGDLKRESNVTAFVRDTNAKLGVHQPDLGVRCEGLQRQPSLEVENPAIAELEDVKDSTIGRRKGDKALYTYYMKEMGWHRLAFWILLTVLTGAAEKIPQIFLRIWFENDPTDSRYFGGFAALSVAYVLLTLVMTFVYYLVLVPSASNALHLGAVRTIFSATLPFLLDTDSGSIVSRFSQDMTLVAQILPRSLLEVAFMSVIAIFTIGIIASGASYAAAIIPLFFVVLYFVQFFYLRTSRQLRLLDLESKALLFTHFSETSEGIRHIRAFEWQPNFTWQCHGMLDYSQKPYYYMFCIQRWLTVVLELSTCAIAVLLVSVAVCLQSSSSETAIGLAMLNLIVLSELLNQVIDSWIVLETSLGAVARIRHFNNTTPVEGELDKKPGVELPQHWPTEGRVQLKDVTARYKLTGSRSEAVLKNINIDVGAGQKIAVTGRTGSGKSTLLLSLLNLLEYSGSITIDGTNIKEVGKEFLRSRITTIPQDCIELATSVRVNLVPHDESRLAHKPTDEAMENILARVGLLDIVKARGGLDASLDSMTLSPGQTQLLCLARAILVREYTRSRIVLIDEATSSVDMESDKRLQAIMAKEFAECTVITVTHRHQGIELADYVIEMADGEITNVIDQRATKGKEVAEAEESGEVEQSGEAQESEEVLQSNEAQRGGDGQQSEDKRKTHSSATTGKGQQESLVGLPAEQEEHTGHADGAQGDSTK